MVFQKSGEGQKLVLLLGGCETKRSNPLIALNLLPQMNINKNSNYNGIGSSVSSTVSPRRNPSNVINSPPSSRLLPSSSSSDSEADSDSESDSYDSSDSSYSSDSDDSPDEEEIVASVTSPATASSSHYNKPTKGLKRKEKKEAFERLCKGQREWNSDFEYFELYFRSKGCKIWKSLPTQPRAYKRDAEKHLKDFFSQPASVYIVYWGGHGLYNGDWCFAGNEYLKLEEVLNLFRQSFNPLCEFKTLVVFSDTCNSGHWTEQLMQREDYELNVIVQAAALKHERAYIVEGTKPRSSLMRKLILMHQKQQQQQQQQRKLQNQKQRQRQQKEEGEEVEVEDDSKSPIVSSLFDWRKQHPTFAMSHAMLEKNNRCKITGNPVSGEIVCNYEGLDFLIIQSPQHAVQ